MLEIEVLRQGILKIVAEGSESADEVGTSMGGVKRIEEGGRGRIGQGAGDAVEAHPPAEVRAPMLAARGRTRPPRPRPRSVADPESDSETESESDADAGPKSDSDSGPPLRHPHLRPPIRGEGGPRWGCRRGGRS